MTIKFIYCLIGILGFAAQDGSQGHGSFHGEPDLSIVGVRKATSLTANDFNGDGRLDLAMLSGENGQMSVLLDQGVTPFTHEALASFDVGTSAGAMTINDFNEDGQLDAAICHHDTDEVWVLIGNGNGTFQPAIRVRVPVIKAHTHTIASADVNRDKHLDLLLAESDDNRAWVLLGDGAGGFAPSSGSPIPTGNHPYGVVTDDFDGDGNLDFATPNWYGKSVSVFLGDGTGRFTGAPKSPLTGFNSPTALDAGDLTGDGIVDLVLGNDDSSEVQILVGDGKGGFAVGAMPNLQAQADCFTPTLADFNGDGKLDVIANEQNGAQTFSYWINLGGGKFSPANALACTASRMYDLRR